MKPSSLKLLKSSGHQVRSRLLLPLAFCLLPVPFCLPIHSPLPAVAQTIDARQAEADRLLQQGEQQYQTRQFPAAERSRQQALQIYRALKNRQKEGYVLDKLILAQPWGDDDKAIEYKQQSLALAREIKDRQRESRALLSLGSAYRSLGNHAKAIEYGQQSLAIVRETRDRQGESRALLSLEFAYRSLGNHAKAIEYGQQSLAVARETKDRYIEGAALDGLGSIYQSLGNDTKAIEYWQQYLAVAREAKDHQEEIAALNSLGTIYKFLGNDTKAIEYWQQYLAVARKTRHPLREGGVLDILGSAYRFLGNDTKAIEYWQQYLAVARKARSRLWESETLDKLGFAYESLGNTTKAVEYRQQSLAIARETKDRQGVVQRGFLGEPINIGNIGNTKTIEYLQQSLAVARKTRDRSSGENAILLRLGFAYQSLGNNTKAIEYLQQSLAVARKTRDRQGESVALKSLETIYQSLGNDTKAIEYLQQSLAVAREKDRREEGIALNDLGLAFLKVGNLIEAEKMLLNGIQVWESIRQMLGFNDAGKIFVFEGQADTYLALQQVRVAQNNPNAALEIAERGRARALVDLLTQRLSSSVNLEIAAAPNQSQIRQIAKSQNATLVQYSIVYDDIRKKFPIDKPLQIQEQLLQIQSKPVRRESALYIWVIQPTGEITFRQVDLKPLWQQHKVSLADLIIGNQEFLAIRSRSPRFAKPQPNLPTLHQLLIDPIASLLPKDPTAHVIFIPQASLFQVPFPALQDTNGTYLIQKHTILTAPSIQVLDLTRQQQQKLASQPTDRRGKALVLGNPTMPKVSLSPGEPKQALSPLLGAEAEARAIAPLLNTQAILGAQGTKAAIVQKMPQASIIHLATHGLLDNVRGLGSAIALGPSGTDNGLLTAEEILGMKLQANLVVLSACNTGEGRITGDGVIGLSRSLISAGVPSVIVSLWAVPDAPTAELMQSFYQNLQKNPNKAQALRQAMLTTMKTHPAPRDWAAFTLIGEAE